MIEYKGKVLKSDFSLLFAIAVRNFCSWRTIRETNDEIEFLIQIPNLNRKSFFKDIRKEFPETRNSFWQKLKNYFN